MYKPTADGYWVDAWQDGLGDAPEHMTYVDVTTPIDDVLLLLQEEDPTDLELEHCVFDGVHRHQLEEMPADPESGPSPDGVYCIKCYLSLRDIAHLEGR